MSSQHGQLVKLDKHPYYYQDPVSQRIYFVKRINGRVKKISSGKTAIKDAKEAIEAKLSELYSEDPNKERRLKSGITNPRLSDLWAELLSQREQRSKATKRTYHISWKYGIEPFWGEMCVSDVTQRMVTKFEAWYMKHNSDRYFYNTRKSLIMLFNYLKEGQYIEAVPKISHLDPLINQKIKRTKVGRVYDDAEVTEILKHLGERYRLAVLMARYMGMRKMEILSREWKDVSFKDGSINIWSFKNKKWRRVPVPKNVLEALKSLRSKSKGDRFIFPMESNPDAHISGQLFDKPWKRAQELAGIEGWDQHNEARFHDLRHTFATQTTKENWPPVIACTYLDMSLKEYDRTYVHVSEADMARWVNGHGKGV